MNRVVKLYLGVLLGCVLLVLSLFVWDSWSWNYLGRKLHISPTATALDQYMRATFTSGMSEDDVHQKLDQIIFHTTNSISGGRYEECEIVYFFIGPPLLDPAYTFCYDDGRLQYIALYE